MSAVAKWVAALERLRAEPVPEVRREFVIQYWGGSCWLTTAVRFPNRADAELSAFQIRARGTASRVREVAL